MACVRPSLLLACALLAAAAAPQKAPRYKACRRDQPPAQLNECVREVLQRNFPQLVKGIPDYGLTTIDPLEIGNLDIPKNKNSSVSVELSFRNISLLGLKNLKIKSIDVNLEKYRLKGKVEVPGSVHLQGDYTIKGKVLVLPILGEGRCNITLEHIKADITDVQLKSFMKNNKEYIQVTSLKLVVYDTKRVYYSLENLFNGNKELGDNILLVMNDNWRAIFDDMIGPVQKSLAEALRNIVNKVAKHIPVDALFPKDN